MKVLKLFFPALLLFALNFANAQDVLSSENLSVVLDGHGRILSYRYGPGKDAAFSFRNDQYAGFAFEEVTLEKEDSREPFRYVKTEGNLHYHLRYSIEGNRLKIEAGIKNISEEIFLPEEGVKLITGINTYMEKYPDWDHLLFPTMQRCEKTHFTSYFMSPEGKILVMASPDPVASWSNIYETREKQTDKGTLQIGLHRIFTTTVDLLHRSPLPERHPQHLYALQPGEDMTITLYLQAADNLRAVNPILHEMTGAPILSSDLYTIEKNTPFQGEILARNPYRTEIRTPRNEIEEVRLIPEKGNRYSWSYLPRSGEGEYTLTMTDRNGKTSEMKLFVRPECSRYLSMARKEGLRSRPTTTHHAECFYPFYSYFLARKHLPSTLEDQEAEEVFDSLFPVLYDRKTGEMRNGKARLQDAATMAGVLCDRFQVTGKRKDLSQASALVDYLICCQGEDGALYVPGKHIHYSSVIYPIKSILEVVDEEKKLASSSKEWEKRYQQHRKAAFAALDNLALLGDNIGTEGQMTFEDGMISCSITQLALGALKCKDSRKRETYLAQAENLYRKHRCLTQSLIPDARMNGATLRFWEYQYAVNLMHNALNSPCGWSSWKLYGAWYLYLLTGERQYMQDFLNGIGSVLQLLDLRSGELRFSFLADPYIDAFQFTETPVGSGQPVLNRIIVGEQYISQSSSWHKADPYAWRPTKFGIDNFVHEVFKCMSETLLENAFVLETEEGLKGINCRLENTGGKIQIKFNDTTVHHLHVNLSRAHTFLVEGKTYPAAKGTGWLTGTPSSLQTL